MHIHVYHTTIGATVPSHVYCLDCITTKNNRDKTHGMELLHWLTMSNMLLEAVFGYWKAGGFFNLQKPVKLSALTEIYLFSGTNIDTKCIDHLCLICDTAGLNRYPTPFFSLNELLTVEKIKRFYTEMSIACCRPIYRPSGDQQRRLFVSKGHS